MKELQNPTTDEFLKATRNLRDPVVIHQLFQADEPISSWTPELFRKRFGELKIKCWLNQPEGDWFHTQDPVEIKISEFINQLESDAKGSDRYYAGQIILSRLPEIKKDIRIPGFLSFVTDRKIFDLQQLWWGKNNATQLHFDVRNTLLCQVWDEKEVWLYPPRAIGSFYPLERFPTSSKVRRPDQMNLDDFPRFQKYQPIKVLLMPGDAVFIPVYWWHFVKGTEKNNLSLSFHWFEQSLRTLVTPYFWQGIKDAPILKLYQIFFAKADRKYLNGMFYRRMMKPFYGGKEPIRKQ